MIAEHVKHGGLHVGGIEKSDGGVGLRVEIDQQSFLFALGDGGGEIDGCGGLAHAALLIGNGQNGGHRVPPVTRGARLPVLQRLGRCPTWWAQSYAPEL